MSLARISLYLLWMVVTLALIILVGMTVALTVYDDKIEAQIADKIYENTGRKFEIAEGFGFRFKPHPTLIIRNLRMENAAWSDEPWMLEIERVEASLSVTALLLGQLKIASLKAQKPTMLIEHKEGKTNWIFGKKRPHKVFTKLAKHLVISKANVSNGRLDIHYEDRNYQIKVDRITGKTHWFGNDVELHALGQTNNEPIDVRLIVDDFISVLLREPTRLSLSGHYGNTKVGATGTIRDLLKWQGLDMQLQAETPNLTTLQPWIVTKLPETPRLTANARFVQPERWQSASFEEIHLISTDKGGVTELTGRVDKIKGWKGINLSGKADYQTQAILEWKGFKPDTDAHFQGEFSITGSKQAGIGLSATGQLNGQQLSGTISGKIPNLLLANSTQALEVTLNTETIDQLGLAIGKSWPKTRPVEGRGELRKLDGRWGLSNIVLSWGGNDNPFASGQLFELGPETFGQLSVKMALTKAEISEFNQLNSVRFPEVEVATVAGEVAIAAKQFSANQVQINLQQGENSLNAKGEVEDLTSLSIKALLLDATIADMPAVNQLYQTKLPDFGVLSAKGQLQGDRESGFGIFNLAGNATGQAHQISFSGKLTNLGKKLTSQLNLDMSGAQVHSFQHLISFDLPEGVIASGQAVLSSQSATKWRVSELDVDLKQTDHLQAHVEGGVTEIPNDPQYSLGFTVNNASHLFLSQFTPFALPPLDEFRATGKVMNAYQQPVGLENVELYFRHRTAEIAAIGKVGQLSPLASSRFELTLSAEDFRHIPWLNLDSANEDISASGHASIDFSAEKWVSNIRQFDVGKSQMAGNLIWAKGDQKSGVLPTITATVKADNIELKQLVRRTKRTQLFSHEPLNLEWAKEFNGSLKANINEFHDHSYNMHNLRFNAMLNQGVLQVPGITTGFGNGQLTGWLTVDTNGNDYSAVTALNGRNLKPDDFNLPDSDYIERGTFDVDLGVAGQGRTVAEIMGTAYGKLKLTLNNAAFKNTNLDLFGSDLVFGIINKINPLNKDDALIEIECGVIHFPIVKGIAKATRGIAIKTKRFTILGGGTVDLGSEAINLLIRPKPRTGLGLSPSSVAQIIQLGGKIGKPKIELGKTGILEAGANIGVAVLTGGWSLLAKGLYDRTKANADVCSETNLIPNLVDVEVVDLSESIFHEAEVESENR